MKRDHRIGNKFRQTHGKTNTPEFWVWRTMKSRCNNPNRPEYKRYGGRGIKVCERWLKSFQNFYDDMGQRPSKYHQIDRINNDGNYEPANCKWVMPSENANNTSANRLITWNGETRTITEWARSLNLNRAAIGKRLANGWTVEQSLTIPNLNGQYRGLRHKTPEEILTLIIS
jgi:hypothetical protein